MAERVSEFEREFEREGEREREGEIEREIAWRRNLIDEAKFEILIFPNEADG